MKEQSKAGMYKGLQSQLENLSIKIDDKHLTYKLKEGEGLQTALEGKGAGDDV